jgi:hypothetical protein
MMVADAGRNRETDPDCGAGRIVTLRESPLKRERHPEGTAFICCKGTALRADATLMVRSVDRLPRVADHYLVMRTRRRQNHRWALLLAAAVTLLPPGAWSLCLDQAGHMAIEPTAWPCAEGEVTSASDEAVCGTTAHDDCQDYVLLHGQFTTVRDFHSWELTAQAVAVVPMGVGPDLRGPHARWLSALRSRTCPPRTAPTILRC